MKSSTGEPPRSARPAGRRTSALPLVIAAWLLCSVAAALAPGQVPPPIDLADRSGRKVDLEELRGKVVLVDFWASWCGPCRQELPFLEALHQKFESQGLVVVGISIDRSAKKMSRFLESVPLSFRIVHDPNLSVASRYEPSAMPSSYFIARDGKVRYVHEGFRKKDAADIESRLRTLLAERPALSER
ncbi:MAG: TlpA disulfide reductase family protein [Myxococcales bacterium]